MTKTIASFVILCIAGVFASGCGGPDCVAICDEINACTEDTTNDSDCAKVCSDDKAEAEAAGCKQQYDDILACIDAVPDVCMSSPTDCTAESNAYGECLSSQ